MIRFICRAVNYADVGQTNGPAQIKYITFEQDAVDAMEKFLRNSSQYSNHELIGCELLSTPSKQSKEGA